MENINYISNPLTQNLQNLILKLGLEPDWLSACVAKIKLELAHTNIYLYSEVEQKSIFDLQALISKIRQPAFLFKDLGNQFNSNDFKSLSSEFSISLNQAESNPHSSIVITSQKVLSAYEEYVFSIEVIANNLPTSLEKIRELLNRIVSIYKQAWAEWESADLQTRYELTVPKAELTSESLMGETQGFYYIPNNLAHKLICRDSFGYLKRTNIFGNHPVAAHGGIHFKPNPEGHDFVSPGMEYAMYSFYTLLGGSHLAAPTTLIKVSNIRIDYIERNISDDNEVRKKFIELTCQNFSVDQILNENPGLRQKLIVRPKEIERVIQAGQTINGVSLDHLLSLIEKYQWLKNISGEKFLSQLEGVITNKYIEKFSGCNLWVKNKFSAEKLMEAFQLLLKEKNTEFKDFKSSDNLNIFNTLNNKLTNNEILQGLALISYWPEIIYNQNYKEIIELPKILSLLNQLFPNKIVKQIDNFFSDIFNKIDNYKFTALIFASLLTNPSDGKADNYMAVFKRNNQGEIESWWPICIDGDQALVPAIAMTRNDGMHYPSVKNILYCLPSMQQQINKTFAEYFLSQTPEYFILKWLGELFLQNQRYQRLKLLHVLNHKDLTSEDGNAALDIPICLEPSIVPLIRNKFKLLQSHIVKNQTITLHAIFEKLEPILALFYQAVLKSKVNPLSAMHFIYNGDETSPAAKIEEILKLQLKNNVSIPDFTNSTYIEKTIEEALQPYNKNEWSCIDNRTQSIEETVIKFINDINFHENLHGLEQLFPVLSLIGEYFPFINHLPNFSKEQFNKILLLAVSYNDLAFKPLYIVKFALRAGADVNSLDPNKSKRNALHFALFSKEPNLEIIKELLSCPNRIKNVYDTEGNSALWLAFSLHSENIALLDLLLTSEDIEHTYNEKTLLDKAIDKDLPLIFLALINKGAGRKTNAEKLLNFINNYSIKNDYHHAFQEAAACLKHNNSDFSWLVLRNTLMPINSMKVANEKFVQIEGVRSGKRYITPEIAAKLLEATTGEIKGNNKYGRRTVAYINFNNEEAHFKGFPELPLVEEAVRSLDRIIFDKPCVVESEIFCFQDKLGRKFPVLVSQHVAGENLQVTVSGMTNIKKMDKSFDQRHFTQLLLLTLLVNPEDGKPDNMINGIMIDNDHAFVEPVVKEDGKRVTQVKTIIYCLNQMLKPLDKVACEAFLQLKPAEILEQWLQHLIDVEQKIDSLFSEADYNRLAKERDCILRLFFQPRATATVYEKFIKIQAVLKANPNVTGIKLLREIIPLLGIVYEEVFKKYDNPGTRFYMLFQHSYSMLAAERFNTLTTPKKMLASAKIPEAALLVKSIKYSAKDALSELKAMIHENNSLTLVRDDLREGKIKRFSELLCDSSQEKVLEELNVYNLNPKLQLSIFKVLEGKALTTLNIANCTSVSYKSLESLLTHSPALLFLNLSGCSQIESKILISLAESCPTIEKLRLDNLPWVNIYSNDKKHLVFPNLRRLWLNNNPRLNSIKLIGLYLVSLEMKDMPALEVIDIHGNALESLVLSAIPSKTEPYITKLLIQSPKLFKDIVKRVKLDQPLNAADIARYCSSYVDNQPWSETVAKYILEKGDLLNLSRNNISELGFTTLLSYAHIIRAIDLRGCTRIDWQNLAKVIQRDTLEKIQLTDYTKPKEQVAKTIESPAAIYTLAVNTNGELISAGKDKTIKVYEAQYQQEIMVLEGHKYSVTALLCLANNTIISGDSSGFVKIWNPLTKKCEITFKGHANRIAGFRYSYKHQILISVSDTSIKYWDIYTGECLRILNAGTEITCIETMNDDTFVVGTSNGTIQVWDIANCMFTRKVEKEHKGFIYALKRVNSRYLASAGGDKTTKIWDIERMTWIANLVGHSGSVNCLEVLLGGKILATGANDNTIKIWDIMTGQCFATFANKDHSNFIKSLVAYSYNRLVSAGDDGKICFWQFPIKIIDLKFVDHSAFTGEIDVYQSDNTSIAVTFENHKENQTLPITLLNNFAEVVTKCLGHSGLRVEIKPDMSQILFNVENSFVNQAVITVVNSLKARFEVIAKQNLKTLNPKQITLGKKQDDFSVKTNFQRSSVSLFLKNNEKRHSFFMRASSASNSELALENLADANTNEAKVGANLKLQNF